MAEKVNIASLTIDTDDVLKESVRLRKEIDKLKESQKELKDSGEDTSTQYVQQESQLKKLNKSYRDNQKFVEALNSSNEDLNETLKVEGKSRQELLDSRAQLNVISKEIQGNTEEEIELREQLNATIDQQTEKIKELSPQYIKQKEEIGAYTEGINASVQGLFGFVQKSEEAGGAFNFIRGGLKAATKQMISFTKSMLTFILTPVGITLTAIAGAFLLIKNAMDRSEESTAKIKTAFAGFSGILTTFQKLIEPVGNFLINVFAKGLEKIANLFAKLSPEIKKNIEANKELVKAELEYTKAQRESRKVQLEYQKQAEKLRQIRDDESKNIQQRIIANEKLGKVLNEQLNEELSLAQKALNLANLRVQLEGETTEALNARAEAETEIADIQERITGQTSEQLVNRVALQKEAAEKAIAIQEAELDSFLKSQEVRNKSLEESIIIEREAAKKKTAILDAELKAKLISQQEYDAEVLNIQNELLRKQAELSVDNARRELQNYIETNRSKLDSDKFLTEQLLNEEKERLAKISEQRKEFEAKRLEEGVISQQEYNNTINSINEENRTANEELKT